MTRSPAAARSTSVYGWYVVFVCTAAYVLSFVDRQILSLLIGPIKADLGISDTAFALLHGFAFSLFYATLGIPVAGLSDRTSRPGVISAGIAVWSLATAACGLAASFAGLFAARIMVGAGEAALSPASYALINDLFPRERLGRAIGVYSLGSFFGAGLAFLAGGAVIAAVSGHGGLAIGPLHLRVWQACFILVGLPGMALAALVALTVRDPHRRTGEPVPGLGAVLTFLMRLRAIFGPHIFGYVMSGWALFATLAWAPAVLTRGYGFGTADAGFWLGLNAIFAGGGGAYASGWLLDRLARAGRADTTFLVGIVGGLGSAVSAILLALASRPVAGVLAMACLQFFSSFPITPSSALTQMVAPRTMRARISALLICGTGLIGAGLGTLLVGLLNDHLFTAPGGVVFSLAMIAGLGGAISAAILAAGCRPMRAWALAAGR
ncbi:MFS transporter [Novosphingobium sp. Fuku2-ISO-50]|uniref:MFS transporter n=1 Tax=Novosphingobium sp. Fuku2-ISO-50 TaxID=1739114 RepID=UPI00076C9A06|nr:MFS transporter [Novosphingobium sp. Fuku2-ISO-50]KUR77599.1 MFS transporter [Novosphingobium sp. Fuku2-ISO-50]